MFKKYTLIFIFLFFYILFNIAFMAAHESLHLEVCQNFGGHGDITLKNDLTLNTHCEMPVKNEIEMQIQILIEVISYPILFFLNFCFIFILFLILIFHRDN